MFTGSYFQPRHARKAAVTKLVLPSLIVKCLGLHHRLKVKSVLLSFVCVVLWCVCVCVCVLWCVCVCVCVCMFGMAVYEHGRNLCDHISSFEHVEEANRDDLMF